MIDLPQKIVCVGLNYRDHAEEQGVALPDRPLLFAKWPNTLIGPGRADRIPAICEKADYEAELGVVIGRRASGVPVDDALDFVRGYVVAQRRVGPRSPVLGRPVGARQVARHVLPDRAAARARATRCPTRKPCRSARS